MATQILGKVAYTSRGAYDSSFSYEINDVVTYNGSSYVSLKETQGNLPTNENYWMLLAKKGETYEVTSEDLADIANQITEDANSEFNKNVKSKTDAFNTNATTKTENFDENATTKTNTFNTNATSKTDAFDENATSKKTDFDTNAKTKKDDFDTNAETKLNEFNENASSYDASIKSNTSRIKRMESNLYDSGVENGSSINIQDSTLAEFQEVDIDGVCEQVTTTGKSLVDFSNKFTGNAEATYENNVLTIVGNGTMYSSAIYYVTDVLKKHSGKNVSLYAKSTSVTNNSTSSVARLEITYSDGTATKYLNLYRFSDNTKYNVQIPTDIENASRASLNVITTTTEAENTIEIEKPMLYIGTIEENVTWEPFSDGQASPRPDWQQPISVIEKGFNIKSVGKNICPTDISMWESGEYLPGDGKKSPKSSRLRTKDLLPVLQDAYFAKCNGYSTIIRSYDKNKNFIRSLGAVSTFTINENEKYISVTLGESTGSITFETYQNGFADGTIRPLISLSSLADKSFEPYQESKIEIPLPDGEFAGKIDDTSKDQFKIKWNDEDKNYHLYLEKNLGKKVLNGSRSWIIGGNSLATMIPNGNIAMYVTIDDLKKTDVRNDVISDKLIAFSNSLWNGVSEGINSYVNDNKLLVSISIDRFEDELTTSNFATLFKNYLSNNNITVIYPIAEPYELDLGSVDMLLTYLGQTNVFTDSELNPNMLVKYYREFVATIRNLQVNNGTLQSELADVQTRLSALETSLNNLLVSQVESEVVE